ncbi:MAG: hypothetical protein CMP32_00230 [Rickettsiales bacterium]|nr:hypothetical protein [Rickettsiales bacterium]
MIEKLKNLLVNHNLDNLIPYIENTSYLVIISLISFLLVFLLLNFFFKTLFQSKENKIERHQPKLNEIVEKGEIKISDDNEFVDVLVAIEEEMAAVRELYVGGYISKGVYISETDRLYEKAKIFGL